MQIKLHKNAKTTPAIRKEIQESKESIYKLAKKYNLTYPTVKKWRDRSNLNDKSSKPKKLSTDLSDKDEALICFERKQYKKTIEDIFFTLEHEIKNLYPMKIYRCLKRHNLSVLPKEFIDAENKIKKFRKYGVGFVHIDLLYAPKINKQRKYVYTAIDRVSKAAYISFSDKKTKESGANFLQKVIEFYPNKINYILTDNGTEFCYKALPKHTKTKKIHPFDKICLAEKINHRTTKFNHPWTNGMAERFNRKVKDNVLKKFLFADIFEMEAKTLEYVDRYNHNIRLKSLDYKTPKDYLFERKGVVIERVVI